MPFYAPGFDPVLIVSQIAAMQALLYLSLGFWLLVLNGLAGSSPASIGLRHLFSPDAISISYAGGWITILALFLNAVAGAVFLCLIVERAKKCLDFAATAHLLHLCCCYQYSGIPSSWEWWAVNLMSLVLMALLSEFLCMRRELQDIPLFTSLSSGRNKFSGSDRE